MAFRKRDDREEAEIEETEYQPSRFVPGVVLALALAGFVSLAWYAYTSGTRPMSEDELMLVQADNSPVKEQPADPGGMKFPNQDKSIFEAISGSAAKHKAEQLAPPPEEPMARDTAEAPKEEAEPETPPLVEAVTPVAPEPVESVEVAEVPVKTAEPEPVDLKPAASAPAKPKPTPKEKEAAKPAPVKAEGSATVQLGAYKSEAEAKAAWSAATKKYKPLAARSPSIVKADLGAKGIFYRLRVSGVDAKAVCAAVQPCMPVK